MIEYYASTGGRYTYTDDFNNLQNLALANSQVFVDHGNFVLTGCSVTQGESTYSVSEGYVYLDNKIRYIAAKANMTGTWYIVIDNTTENVAYANSETKQGRTLFQAAWSQTYVTGKSITFTSAGCATTSKTSFFGKYALLKDYATQQTVEGAVTFAGATRLTTGLLVGSSTSKVEPITNGIVIGNGRAQLDGIEIDTTSIRHKIGGDTKLTIATSLITADSALQANVLQTAKFKVNADGLSEYATDGAADLWINKYGYNGSNTQYRTTKIGNGQGSLMMSVAGHATAPTVTFYDNDGSTALLTVQGGDTKKVTVAKPLYLDDAIYLKKANGDYEALADRYLTVSAFSTTISSYSTTAQMNTAISNQLATALQTYSTTAQMNSAIAEVTPTLGTWTTIYDGTVLSTCSAAISCRIVTLPSTTSGTAAKIVTISGSISIDSTYAFYDTITLSDYLPVCSRPVTGSAPVIAGENEYYGTCVFYLVANSRRLKIDFLSQTATTDCTVPFSLTYIC